MAFGQNLKKYLDSAGIKVTELARDVGIPATTIYSMIKNDSAGGNSKYYLPIMKALKLTDHVLLDDEWRDFMIERERHLKEQEDIDADKFTVSIEMWRIGYNYHYDLRKSEHVLEYPDGTIIAFPLHRRLDFDDKIMQYIDAMLLLYKENIKRRNPQEENSRQRK